MLALGNSCDRYLNARRIYEFIVSITEKVSKNILPSLHGALHVARMSRSHWKQCRSTGLFISARHLWINPPPRPSSVNNCSSEVGNNRAHNSCIYVDSEIRHGKLLVDRWTSRDESTAASLITAQADPPVLHHADTCSTSAPAPSSCSRCSFWTLQWDDCCLSFPTTRTHTRT